jgi:hypothetical protein
VWSIPSPDPSIDTSIVTLLSAFNFTIATRSFIGVNACRKIGEMCAVAQNMVSLDFNQSAAIITHFAAGRVVKITIDLLPPELRLRLGLGLIEWNLQHDWLREIFYFCRCCSTPFTQGQSLHLVCYELSRIGSVSVAKDHIFCLHKGIRRSRFDGRKHSRKICGKLERAARTARYPNSLLAYALKVRHSSRSLRSCELADRQRCLSLIMVHHAA